MTCKDCYGCKICAEFGSEHLPSDLDSRYFEYKDIDNVEQECSCFKDKSLIIELPCKVGDAVYSISRTYRGINKYYINEIHILDNQIIFFGNDEEVERIRFETGEIGKTVFLDEKKAEERFRI